MTLCRGEARLAALLCVLAAASAVEASHLGLAPAPRLPAVSTAPARLRVNGSQLIDPHTGKPVRLTGFNWPIMHVHDGDGATMQHKLPGSNVARVVALLWDNNADGHDCRSPTPPYVTEGCLKKLDWALTQATSAGVWAIVTCRAEYAAGQRYQSDPMSDVFHNATLRAQMYAMWAHVAARYATWDYIAAYEIMSEPRDKGVSATTIRDFYQGGCSATQAVDPATPCMVGPGHYYSLYGFTGEAILQNNTNVIYALDYFDPAGFVFGQDSVPTYPGTYPCDVLYAGWADTCCRGPGGAKAPTTFDAEWSAHNLAAWAMSVRSQFNVPVVIDQWSVVHGVAAEAGHYTYMADLAKTMQHMGVGWMYFVWRGGGGSGWTNGSSEIVYYLADGTPLYDTAALDALAPYMSNSDPASGESL